MPQVNLNGLVAVFKDIFSQSQLLQGRFAILRASSDINTTNFGLLLKDNLTGIQDQQKFPGAVMMPPFKLKKNDQRGFGKYKIQIYFLVLDKRNANNDIKNVDAETNLSMQNYIDDWNDTNLVADQFFMTLFNYLQKGNLLNAIHEDKDTRQYHFITAIGNDKLNGCHVTFDVSIWEGDNCNALNDYPNPIVVNVIDFSPNTLNKQ